MRLRALAVLLFAGGTAVAQPASDTSTADAARALYVEGKELREAGNLKKSLEKLEAAHALYATPITALEVGRGRALVGKLRGAIEVLESIERLPVKANESAKATSARAEARALLAQYRTRIPKLKIHVENAEVRVWVDGEVVPGDALASAWLVDAGTHHVEAALGERRTSKDVRIAEGEERDVMLRFDIVPPPPASSTATVVAPPPAAATMHAAPPREPRELPESPNVLAYVGFGVAALGLATGGVTGIMTLTRASDIKPQCTGGVCPASANLDSAQTLGTVSTVSFVVGGVGLGVGVAALVFVRHDTRMRTGAWVEPWFMGGASGSSVGLRGGF